MTYKLAAATRKVKGEKVRYEGLLPAVVYGANGETLSLSLNPIEFIKLYRQAGDSSLIDLSLDGKEAGKVLVQEVAYEPVKDMVIHVDLRRIDMNKMMTAPVHLKFVGEAPVIKASGGTLVTAVSVVEVKCLPKDLVSQIEVDLSPLVSYENLIKVKDLKLPVGITVVKPHTEDLIVKAAAAMTEEEIKALEAESTATVDLSKIESAKPKKVEEGEEGAEGVATADKAAAGAAAKKDEKSSSAKASADKKEEKKK